MQRIKTRPGSGMWEARPCRGLQYAGFSSAPLRRSVPSSISHRAGGVRGGARSRGRRSKDAHSTPAPRRSATVADGQCSHDSSDEGAIIPRACRLSSVSWPDMTITPRLGIMIDTSLCISARFLLLLLLLLPLHPPLPYLPSSSNASFTHYPRLLHNLLLFAVHIYSLMESRIPGRLLTHEPLAYALANPSPTHMRISQHRTLTPCK